MNKLRLLAGVLTVFGMACTFIATYEGKDNHSYPDPVDIQTICFGHTAGVKFGDKKTDAECEQLLMEDVKHAQDIVHKYVKVPLTANQEVALISFVYNVGEANFRKSTLLKLLNRGDYAGACNQMPKWVYSKGEKLPGLVKRRTDEKNLCLTGDT